jgi:nucleoside-diphosphate-sugar epimerase
VTPPAKRVRSRRRGDVIAITGAASGAGRALAEQLAAREDVRKVIAIDDTRGDLAGVVWRVVDVADPGIVERLAGADCVVHLAVDMSVDGDAQARMKRNIRGTQTVVTAAAAVGAKRVVLCTSAMVYGASPENPVPLDEDAPLRALPDGALVGDLLEMERVAASSAQLYPGTSVTVVRPATLVGPGVDTVLTRHFESPRLLVVRDGRPAWQFCHVEDLVSALELAALGKVEGAVTVGSEGWLEQDDVERLSGLRRLELPAQLAFGTAERLHRLGVTPAPASDLQYVTYPWVIPSTKLRAAGWRPAYDNVTAFMALLDQVAGRHAVVARRVGRRDATLGAAGATVAMVGAAAVIRARRRRRAGG